MPKGLDTPQSCAKLADKLKNHGFDFVARYYNVNKPKKNLTLPEARALTDAGLSIVAVWENGFPTKASYFSYTKGVDDATSAYHYAMKEIGQPAGSPIYFAVDYDASLAEVAGGINDYFRGIQKGFETISSGQPAYPIGVYGSGLVCGWLLDHNRVEFAWLSQSMGFRGSKQFTRWNIKQGPGTTLLGLDIDTNESNGHGGGFQIIAT